MTWLKTKDFDCGQFNCVLFLKEFKYREPALCIHVMIKNFKMIQIMINRVYYDKKSWLEVEDEATLDVLKQAENLVLPDLIKNLLLNEVIKTRILAIENNRIKIEW